MPILQSKTDTASETYSANHAAMETALARIKSSEQFVEETANKAKQKFAQRKQLLPRERLNLLLDRGTPFLEIASLAGYKMHDDKDGVLCQ